MPRSLIAVHVLPVVLLVAVCLLDSLTHRALLAALLLLAWAALEEEYTRWIRQDTLNILARRLTAQQAALVSQQNDE